MTNPIHAYSHEPSGCYAITGGAFVPKGIWSASYDDDYLYADLVCGKIFRMSPRAGGGLDVSEWATGIESPITMTFGPAAGRHALYYATWAGERSPGAAHHLHGRGPRRVPAPEGRLAAARVARAGVRRLHGCEPHARAAARAPGVQPAGADRRSS